MQARFISVLGEETRAFADAFNASYALNHYVQKIISRNINLCIVTDLDSLLKVITWTSNMTEKKVKNDVQAGREAYQDRNIDGRRWIKSEVNLADGRNKINRSDLIQQ